VEVFFKFLWKNPAFSSLAVYSLLLLVLFWPHQGLYSLLWPKGIGV
jgi:hypothetical protein